MAANEGLSPISDNREFYELWAVNCDVCMFERDVFFINKCPCNVYIRKQCYRSVRNHAEFGLYKCVMCSKENITGDYMSTKHNIVTRTLSNSERKVPKKNWRTCFKLYDGYNIILKYHPKVQQPMYQFIHGQLLTPTFKYINLAGLCLNMSEARLTFILLCEIVSLKQEYGIKKKTQYRLVLQHSQIHIDDGASMTYISFEKL